jgi:hypothetical protein
MLTKEIHVKLILLVSYMQQNKSYDCSSLHMMDLQQSDMFYWWKLNLLIKTRNDARKAIIKSRNYTYV